MHQSINGGCLRLGLEACCDFLVLFSWLTYLEEVSCHVLTVLKEVSRKIHVARNEAYSQ